MMKFFLSTLFFISFFTSAIAQKNKTDRKFQPDKNINKYINKLNAFKSNAIYISASDYIINKSYHLGFQRRLTNWYWAEAGVSFGAGEMVFEEHFASFMGNGKYEVNAINKFNGNDPHNQSMKENMGIHIGAYRTIVGLPPVNSVSYGLNFKYQTFDYNYVAYDQANQNQLQLSSKLKATSVLATLNYKTNIVANLGFEIGVGLGPAFLRHAKDTNPNNILSGYKTTKLNFGVQFKFYYAF